ncbi:MAG: Clp protease ClpP [Syntrophorhabdaceae bacterium]|nr:Clp protease ClpP [Syntrophorhabdaceae bacterium]
MDNLSYRTKHNAKVIAAQWGKSPNDRADWYRIEDKADGAEILIYDVIGFPFVEAKQFIKDLGAIKAKQITVRLNSPGGNVFDGVAVYNALKNHPAKITTRIEGLAASIASVIALAGDEVQAYANTMYMIHDPWVMAVGNQEDLRSIADVLEKIGGQLADIYTGKTGLEADTIKEMMHTETWMTAQEGKGLGFVDKVLDGEGKTAKAKYDLKNIYSNVPEDLSFEAQLKTFTAREIERVLIEAGASRAYAKMVAARGCTGVIDDHREDDDDAIINTLLQTIKGEKIC